MIHRLLFVDDSRKVLDALARMLRGKRDTWDMTFVDDPREAWQLVQSSAFDALTLDVNMPILSGLDLLERIKRNEGAKDIPVVMLTGLGDRELKRRALDLGAADLLSKPVEPEDLVARIQSVLRLKTYQDRLKHENAWLERKVQERTVELYRSRMEVVWRLGKAAEHRDTETGNHVIRVGYMSRAIATALGLEEEFVETLFVASPLHDIGKIGVPDAILLKQGPLSDAERQVMMRHCRIGERILKEDAYSDETLQQFSGAPAWRNASSGGNPMTEMAARIALCHHEKWDGSGYPEGLAGTAIPLEARITAIADVFDALTSQRPYKPALDEERALAIIDESVGSHFDPQVHEAFHQALPELRSIRNQLEDYSNDPQYEDGGHAPNLVRR